MTDLLSYDKDPPQSEKVTTPQVMDALRTRFAAPEYALFENVGNAGSRSSVYADGVAMNMWASRGYALTGFEVKISRSDWLRELKQPGKSDPILRKCDFWYLVAPDDVFKIDEVPIPWGVLGYKNGKLFERRKAPKLEPTPISREFVSQLLRRSMERDERDLQKFVDKALQTERTEMEKTIQRRVEDRTRHLKRDGQRWVELMEKIGEHEYTPVDEVVQAIKVVMTSGVASTYSGIEELLRKMQRSTEELEKAAAMFRSTSSDSSPLAARTPEQSS